MILEKVAGAECPKPSLGNTTMSLSIGHEAWCYGSASVNCECIDTFKRVVRAPVARSSEVLHSEGCLFSMVRLN